MIPCRVIVLKTTDDVEIEIRWLAPPGMATRGAYYTRVSHQPPASPALPNQLHARTNPEPGSLNKARKLLISVSSHS